MANLAFCDHLLIATKCSKDLIETNLLFSYVIFKKRNKVSINSIFTEKKTKQNWSTMAKLLKFILESVQADSN